MPAEWAINAMALLGGAARGYAEGAQQRFGNQMAMRGQALQERQQMAGEKASQDQENRLRVQLRHDIETAEREMQFKYVQLDATKQMALMDQTLRYEQNQQGWQGLAIDREKLHVLTDMEMYKFNNVPASQWAEQAARKGYIDQQGGIDRILQSAGFTHDEKMGFASYVYGSKLAKEAVDNAIRQAGGVAGATYPTESAARKEAAGLGWKGMEYGSNIAMKEAEFGANLGEWGARRGHGRTLQGMEYGANLGMKGAEFNANLKDWQEQRGQGREQDTMRVGAGLERETMRQGQALEMQGNMMANPDVVQAWGQNVFQRWMGNFQSYTKGGYSPNQAALAADKFMENDLAGLQVPEPVKYQIRQAASLHRQSVFGNAPAQGAYRPYAQPRNDPRYTTPTGNAPGRPVGQKSPIEWQKFLMEQSYGPYNRRKLGPQW